MIRRVFIRKAGLGTAGIALSGLTMPPVFANGAPNKKIVVAIVGVNGRGNGHASMFAGMPDCEIGYICDVDERAMAKTIDAVAKVQTQKPKGEKDFRKVLEANIALLTQQTLEIDPKNGHILNNPEAQKFWSKEYEKGWEPKV